MAAGGVSLTHLLRPHWKLLAVAFVAMLVQSAADLLEPWPLKVIFDYVLGAKPMPAWLAEWMPAGGQALDVLDVAAAAVIVIAVVGAVSSYTEKYLADHRRQARRLRPAAPALSPRPAAVAVLLRAAADRRHGRPADQRHRRGRGFHLVGGPGHRAQHPDAGRHDGA